MKLAYGAVMSDKRFQEIQDNKWERLSFHIDRAAATTCFAIGDGGSPNHKYVDLDTCIRNLQAALDTAIKIKAETIQLEGQACLPS